MIIDCLALAKELNAFNVRAVKELKQRGIAPKLCEILATSDAGVLSYAETKKRQAAELGVLYESFIFDYDASLDTVLEKIRQLNQDKSAHGIVIGLPVFAHLDSDILLNEIAQYKDIDGLGSKNTSALFTNQEQSAIAPATPAAALYILESLSAVSGKKVCILGRGRTVGRPLLEMLINRNATVTVCHSKTAVIDIEMAIAQSDIVMTAIGIAGTVKSEWFKAGQIVIDCGISFINGKTSGDVNSAELSDLGAFVTPVPKGAGAVTNAMIFANLIKAVDLQ
ncbi:bifunctional 5,10-methylenetetrahydrofolate dehydrogenase/5,10-methenyltetrahydrofolate cyclohydrolase [Iodobacter sp. HSC-16F04]|uniref:Bifunctional protein FolD n=1 Tax=Iodobacter violaceini TaxID=3044271 RepID=A0ABX0KQ62_9NEIS|nr:bifunctional 5,10-methylenetetrahydrofolate dehydrogenase/5,10-methenyltetrahydrofolate cyclohydrolase [Iodobacter violacea]NHQ84532.1 bifunctional 5,10-methylenetetrahydrofolate dehydrogenase/5,10-methenyltetrahydrofolate cyclohydrolase [Iodobacter violacea]